NSVAGASPVLAERASLPESATSFPLAQWQAIAAQQLQPHADRAAPLQQPEAEAAQSPQQEFAGRAFLAAEAVHESSAGCAQQSSVPCFMIPFLPKLGPGVGSGRHSARW